MHQHGVAHLDIKPDNIMVEPKYIPFKVSIIDFDVSMKVKDVETTTEGMVGTRGWIAPEVAKGGRYSPILADRWACEKMLLYFGEHAKLTVEMEELCYGLMSMDPTARPPLSCGNVQTVLEEQSDEDSE
ncbi:hypothetical protein FRC18_010021 [Serendipita sp. 400]|nr:hypothetical protein FRC18_010021 [Serendipita sp. 400]